MKFLPLVIVFAVIYEGKIMGILEGNDLNKETLGLLMAGATIDEAIGTSS